VTHVQSGRKVRLSSSHKLFGNERETVDEAYPGDIIGLVGHDGFGIGDTLSTDPKIRFDEIPRFTPEVFEYFHNPNTAKFKQFRQGLDQLLLEGVAQAFHLKDTASRVPLLAAVGPLQFEVLQYRLETEYNAETRREAAPASRAGGILWHDPGAGCCQPVGGPVQRQGELRVLRDQERRQVRDQPVSVLISRLAESCMPWAEKSAIGFVL